MSDTVLPNTGLTQPAVGADGDTWGNTSNDNWALLDALFGADAILNVANGGTGVSTLVALVTALGVGLVKISTGSVAAGTASQWISLTGGYTKYKLVLENFVPATASRNLSLQASTDNRSTTLGSGQYGFSGRLVDIPPGADIGANAADFLSLNQNQANTANIGSLIVVDIKQASASSRFRLTAQSQYLDNAGEAASFTGGYALGETAITDILLSYNGGAGGNIGVSSQSATWTLYGYS